MRACTVCVDVPGRECSAAPSAGRRRLDIESRSLSRRRHARDMREDEASYHAYYVDDAFTSTTRKRFLPLATSFLGILPTTSRKHDESGAERGGGHMRGRHAPRTRHKNARCCGKVPPMAIDRYYIARGQQGARARAQAAAMSLRPTISAESAQMPPCRRFAPAPARHRCHDMRAA